MEAIVKANWYSKNDKYLNNPHLTCREQEWSTSILVARLSQPNREYNRDGVFLD